MKVTRTKSLQSSNAPVRVYPPNEQGSGSFDGGKITEIKPIGFPGEGSARTRIGPLFYWAWATANGPATIALHPHKGFEIASYVLKGQLGHSDTGGHESRVGKGGVQVMQTGSGISHEERTFADATDFFQIWFEPNLTEALTRPPEYHEASDAELPVTESEGVRIKSIIGGKSPIKLVVDAQMEHLALEPNATYEIGLSKDRTQSIVVVSGDFEILNSAGSRLVQVRDFLVAESRLDGVQLRAGSTGGEFVVVDVPIEVSYPLLAK